MYKKFPYINDGISDFLFICQFMRKKICHDFIQKDFSVTKTKATLSTWNSVSKEKQNKKQEWENKTENDKREGKKKK